MLKKWGEELWNTSCEISQKKEPGTLASKEEEILPFPTGKGPIPLPSHDHEEPLLFPFPPKEYDHPSPWKAS